MSKRSSLLFAPALAALCACVSYPPYENSPTTDETTGADSAAQGEESVRCYDLAQVTTWTVEGSWTEAEASGGRPRQANGEGPWKVLVLLKAESEPRVHDVHLGARVGKWGDDVLMIDDSGPDRGSAPTWSFAEVSAEN